MFERRLVWLQPFLLTLSIGAIVGGFLYLAKLDDAPPFITTEPTVHDAKGEPKSVFAPGEVVYVKRAFCVTREGPSDVGRFLVNLDLNIRYPMPGSASVLRKGCLRANQLAAFLIPDYAVPGHYALSVVVQYSNNPFHQGAATLPPALFEVL